MAIVTLDSSEYDMLRETKGKAEKRVKELEKEIDGLRDKSRVILTTKYVYPEIQFDRLISSMVSIINYYRSSNRLEDDPRYSSLVKPSISSQVTDIIKENIKFSDYSFNMCGKPESCSSQYIGFEDVKVRVEEHFKDKIKKSIDNYNNCAKQLQDNTDKVEESIRNAYEGIVNQYRKENENLRKKIAELSKSKDEKIAELIKQIDEAGVKLSELKGNRKNWFNRLFKYYENRNQSR